MGENLADTELGTLDQEERVKEEESFIPYEEKRQFKAQEIHPFQDLMD